MIASQFLFSEFESAEFNLSSNMPVFNVNVKWGKEKFDGVECNTDEPPLVFKATLFSLSSVHPERQKVMIKGTVLKDDSWGNIKITNNANFLMMGSAEELPQTPVQKVVFVEDLTENQLAKAMDVPPGLTNLGNTCYMNATIQCLRSVPELRESLKNYTRASALEVDNIESITDTMRELFKIMDRSSVSIPPFIMLSELHRYRPNFATKNEQGHLQQQDANECLVELMRCLQKRLPGLVDKQPTAKSSKGFMDQFFGGEFQTTMKCLEAAEEEPSASLESFYQLSCFIDKDVKYLQTGLKAGMESEINKHSSSLRRDAKYQKTSKISRLPAYLAIQMVRFYYKEREGVNAKILKDIKFPLTLDAFELCTPELQNKIVPAREAFKSEEDKTVERKLEVKNNDQGEERIKFERKPFSFQEDPGSNNSGFYELQAVLTHKGRSSSSGHYVAWVKGRKADEWLMFDDDQVRPVTSEDVLKLSGGGDWHCAYVLLYGPRVLEVSEDIPKKQDADSKMDES